MRLLLVVVAFAASSCRDECDPTTFAVTCEGNTLVYCPTPGVDQIVPIKIRRQDCETKTCVASPGLCALSSSPDPVCGDGGVTQACESETSLLYCSSGFGTGRAACKSCDGGTCTGGPGTRCTAGGSECAASLGCSDAGFCSQ